MMADEIRINVTVLLGENARDARSLGKHRFAWLPRVGENLIVDDDNQQFVLVVHAVTHFGDSLESKPGKLVPLPNASAQVLCREI